METETYFIVKWIHILSSTVLFGTGLGTALHMWLTHKSGNVQAIAVTARNVVLVDWIFTASTGVLQPLSGVYLMQLAGYNPLSSWLVAAYILYFVAGAAWLMVVALQVSVRDMSTLAAGLGEPLPRKYYAHMRLWFLLGWPAFLSLVAVFWLMATKPDLPWLVEMLPFIHTTG